MNDKNVYIEQSAIESSLFTELQQETLQELQRLSGAVWTNFNSHDPGVTTSDIANNVLSELDYKLGFDLIDYLTLEQTRFAPERYGMYLPEKVYPTTPVTLKDYRKLLLSYFPMLEDVIVELNSDIVIKVVPSSLQFGENMQDFVGNIKGLFNANRNLCESLEAVELCERTMLHVHSEIEIKSKADATTVLAQVYWNILSYLSGGFYFEKYENLLNDELHWEELLEGPVLKKQLVFPRQENTMAELCGILCKIEGIKEMKTCYLAKSSSDLKDIVTDFKEGYSLCIPENIDGLKVKIRIGETEVTGYDFKEFIDKLKALYMLNRSSVAPDDNEIELSRKLIPAGMYRDVYGHRIIAKDFPTCYKVSSPASDGNFNNQFSAYLKLFDLIFFRGLKELNEVKNLLSIKEDASVLSKIDLITSSMGINVSDKDKYRSTFELKNRYLDFLDHLYGVESNPEWIQWGKAVPEKEDDALKRRMAFLREVPRLLQTRSKAWNINEVGSVPTIKEYISYLLGVGMGGSSLYVDALGRYNLQLVESEPTESEQQGEPAPRIEYDVAVNTVDWKIDAVDVNVGIGENREACFKEFLQSSGIFDSGKIGIDIFRGGVDIDNYRILPVDDEFKLVFLNRSKQSVQLLAHSDCREKLEEWANMLRCFLLELDSESEVVYVLENHWFEEHEMSVSFVFSTCSARFSSVVFRNECMRFIRTLLPAHLIMRVYWLTQEKLVLFEPAFKECMDVIKEGDPGKINSSGAKIKGILESAS